MAEETIVNQEQVTETPAETVVERPAETPVEQSAADPRAELKRFMAAFGAANGAEWFAEGLSYEDAKDKHIAALTARVESAEKKLSAVDRGAEEPATFQTADNAPPKHSKYAGNLPDGTARFAASIRKAGDLN